MKRHLFSRTIALASLVLLLLMTGCDRSENPAREDPVINPRPSAASSSPFDASGGVGTTNIAMAPRATLKPLFHLDLSYQKDLNSGKVTERLQKAFNTHGIEFSLMAYISKGKKNSEWQINDLKTQCLIRIEEEGLMSKYDGKDLLAVYVVGPDQKSSTIVPVPLSAQVLPVLRRVGEPAEPRPSTGAMYAVNPSLDSPTITAVTTTDNAVILTWNDTNTTHDGYLIMVWERDDLSVARSTRVGEFRVPRESRATWFSSLGQLPLRSDAVYNISLSAHSPQGMSRDASTAVATLTTPTIRIGDPNGNPNGDVVSPHAALQGFAPWDADGDGIVRDANGSGGAFPLFPGSYGTQPIARMGNQFDRISGGPRANVVVGYFFNRYGFNRYGDETRFVAFHLFIDSATHRVTPVSVLYGDAPLRANTPGTLVWVGSVADYRLQVTEGNPVLGLPNLVEGRVTAPTLASDGTYRVIEYTFRLALLPQ